MKVQTSVAGGRVVASATAILLFSVAAAGCSGSGQKPVAFAGSSSGSSSSAVSSSAAATTSAGSTAATGSATSSAPDFEFPADYSLTIDPDTTGDPVKDEILADDADFWKAYLSDQASGNDKDPVLLQYATPGGADMWQRAVADGRSKGLTITGTERIYHREIYKVDSVKNIATMYVCDDQSKAFDKEIATGKVHLTPVTDDSYILYFFGLKKAANGTWQVMTTTIHQKDQQAKQECR